MPIAPQITNTPIPDSVWFTTSDFQYDSTATVQTTTTFTQSTAPNASAIGDIWFDTSNGNKQYRWDGSSWVAVQDAAIASAASDASTALASANGKNKVTYSTSTPSGTYSNIQTGDTWFVYSGSVITAVYKWDGSSWTSQALNHTVISSIDAGSILAGTITVALGITNPSGNFTVDASTGQLTATGANISGSITASSGSIGGFTIGSGYLNYGSTYFYSGGSGTYALIDNSRIISAYQLVATGTAINSITTSGGIFAGSTNANAISTSGGANIGGTTATYSLSVSNTVYLSGGYGVNSSWSPNTDNTYNLGISGSYRWSHVYANNTTITTSDARLKTEVKPSALGLDFIKSLNPVSYKWIVGGNQIELDSTGNPIIESTDQNGKPVYKTTTLPGKRTHYGLIAQEVKSALDKANVGDFAGWVQDDLTKSDSYQSISYEQFISPLIKAVQELSAQVTELKGKING